MTTILISGLNSNKLITKGYGPKPISHSVTYTARTRVYKTKKQKVNLFEDREFLGLLEEFVETI